MTTGTSNRWFIISTCSSPDREVLLAGIPTIGLCSARQCFATAQAPLPTSHHLLGCERYRLGSEAVFAVKIGEIAALAEPGDAESMDGIARAMS